MSGVVAVQAGFHGKLPSRGDFVTRGLPGPLVQNWRNWINPCLLASQAALDTAWEPAWLSAPIWFFRTRPGVLAAAAVAGLWFPSVDQVGRYYPMLLAASLDPALGIGGPDVLDDWLRAIARPALAALAEDWSPDELAAALAHLPLRSAPPGATDAVHWWTDGGPAVPATRFGAQALATVAEFAAMLMAPAGDPADHPPPAPEPPAPEPRVLESPVPDLQTKVPSAPAPAAS